MAVADVLVHAFSTALFFLPLFGLGGLVDGEVAPARFLARDLRLTFAGDPILAVIKATLLQGYAGLQLGFLLASAIFTWGNALSSGKARATNFTLPEKIFLYSTPVKIMWYAQQSFVVNFIAGLVKYTQDVGKVCTEGPALSCLAAPFTEMPVTVEEGTLSLLEMVGVGMGISIVGGIVVMIGGHKSTMEFPSNLAGPETQLKVEATSNNSATVSADVPIPEGGKGGEEEDDEDKKRREIEAEREAMNNLSYAELRDWAKSVGIRANQKKSELIEALLKLDDDVDGEMDDDEGM